ncbi:MAG: hypothetical protein E4H02_12650 [Lentisphaerales bacterium]|nr:MAG: hypothetical protein E4H02_12650 [Lentisphaerales bacterium]
MFVNGNTSFGSDWGDPATQFETASAPTVNNAAADNIGAAGARLNGALTQGGSATATVYWGPTDGGTTPGSWSNSVSLGTVSEGALWTDISGLNETTTRARQRPAQHL